jgi:hypothetical protein
MLLVEGAERFRLVLISQNPTAADSWTKPAPAPPAAARFWYSTTTEVHRDTGKNTSDDVSQDAQESGSVELTVDDDWPRLHAGGHNL